MTARRVIRKTNGTIVKPFVVLAARALGPGPLRLRMVKLAHSLSSDGYVFEGIPSRFEAEPVALDAPSTSRRAA